MNGYKAFKSDWSCRGFQYEIGKTYELQPGERLRICSCGFHFCKNPIDVFSYYNVTGTRIAEVEALGRIEQEGTKYATDKIKIVRELKPEDLQALIVDNKHNTGIENTGRYNSGIGNTGNFNSGCFNTGRYNDGYCNVGSYNNGNYNVGWRNSGDRNSGNSNSGYANTGSYNSGNYNSGSYNSGYSNTGWYNEGNYNSGNYNSGYYNTGLYNSGDFNTGTYNRGNRNSGIFNSDEPFMRAFNKPTTIHVADFYENLDYDFDELMGKIADNNLDSEDVERIKALPNFDADIFKEITGIDIESENENRSSHDG